MFGANIDSGGVGGHRVKSSGPENLKLSIDQGGLLYKHDVCRYVRCVIAFSVNTFGSRATVAYI